MARYLRIPLGKRGTIEDNREQLDALGLLPLEESVGLSDDAWVPVPFEMLSYPHLYVDPDMSRVSQYLAVRVMASPHGRVCGADDVALTVVSGLDTHDAVILVRAIREAIADTRIDVAVPGKYGMLEWRRLERASYYLPNPFAAPADEPSEVAANA